MGTVDVADTIPDALDARRTGIGALFPPTAMDYFLAAEGVSRSETIGRPALTRRGCVDRQDRINAKASSSAAMCFSSMTLSSDSRSMRKLTPRHPRPARSSRRCKIH